MIFSFLVRMEKMKALTQFSETPRESSGLSWVCKGFIIWVVDDLLPKGELHACRDVRCFSSGYLNGSPLPFISLLGPPFWHVAEVLYSLEQRSYRPLQHDLSIIPHVLNAIQISLAMGSMVLWWYLLYWTSSWGLFLPFKSGPWNHHYRCSMERQHPQWSLLMPGVHMTLYSVLKLSWNLSSFQQRPEQHCTHHTTWLRQT